MFQELPRAEALLANSEQKESDLQNLDSTKTDSTDDKKEMNSDNNSDSDSDTDSTFSENEDEDRIQIRLPLDLNLSELAEAILQNNQK